jgi:hypothetical protein
MNGTGARKIEIFAPFNAAMDLTKLILFQPFDIAKWLTIGFAAFLSHLAGGGGGGFNPKLPGKGGDWNWNFRSTSTDALESASWGMPGWVIPLIAIGGLVLLAIVVVCLWVGSRGKFIFTDCIVRNRAAIVQPWHEFRREGNSLFIYSLVVGFGALIALAVLGLPVWLPLLAGYDLPGGPGFILMLVALGTVFVVAGVIFALINSFMVPIMYRRRCGALEAFKAALGLIAAEPGPVILYVLFLLVLWIAFAMMACVLTCLTCCITAIPYVGTVILLPFHVFFASYVLLFVRQFGPDYDAWASVLAAAPATVESTPPVQPPDPPAPPRSYEWPPESEPPAPPPVQT